VYIVVGVQLSEVEGLDLINPFNHIFVHVTRQDLDFQLYVSCLLCVQWFEVRGGCSFCWCK